MQRYFAKEKKDNLFILEDSDIHHICNVMRMKDGDFIEVVFDGILYRCKVNMTDKIFISYDSIMDNAVVSDKEIVVSITNIPEGNMLDAGTWFLECDEDITFVTKLLRPYSPRSIIAILKAWEILLTIHFIIA